MTNDRDEPKPQARPHLGDLRGGWLEDDDPFLGAIDRIVADRAKHRPRSLPVRRRRDPSP